MESVCEVEAAAEKMAEDAGLSEDDRCHVTMAVREAGPVGQGAGAPPPDRISS